MLGYRSDGGYAELVTVPAANLLPIPDTLDFVQAAAFPLTFLTVWHMLVARARVQAGEWVLVLAAGSGVGQAAIQVARLHGARVIATAGTAAKRQHAQDLGADAALDHYAPAWVDEVRALTGGRGVDIVVEHVGEATWKLSIRALARGARLVTCGATTGPNGQLDLRALFARQISLLGSYMGSKGELVRAASLLFGGPPRARDRQRLPAGARRRGSGTPRERAALREDCAGDRDEANHGRTPLVVMSKAEW